MSVFRDFIPDDVAPTRAEEARRATARQFVKGGMRQDFIPEAGHQRKPPSGNREEAGTAAIEAAMSRQAAQARIDFLNAVERQRTLTVAQSIDLIQAAPVAVQEMLLVAEKLYGQRSSILNRFGEPDPAAVEKFKTYLAENPPEDSTEAPTAAAKKAPVKVGAEK